VYGLISIYLILSYLISLSYLLNLICEISYLISIYLSIYLLLVRIHSVLSSPRGSPSALRPCRGPGEMAADQVITALLGAFDAQPSERAASQEALQGWEGMPGYVPLLLQLYAAPPPRLTPDARLLAVVCLKNAVTRHWNARRAGVPAVPDADKAMLRAGLLQTLDEPEPRLSAQLLLLLAQARPSPASPASPAGLANPAGLSRPNARALL
jgi:hypothetical protein